MRIAYSVVKNIRRGGGIEKYTYELGRRLVARGHDIVVFSMGHYGKVETDVEGMRVLKVPCLPYSAAEKVSTGFAAALKATFNGDRFDIIHNHSVGAGAFGIIPGLGGAKTVLQMHGVEWQRSRWNTFGIHVLKALEWLSLKSHHAYTAVSQTQCDFYKEHCGLDMTYIPTGADLKEAVPAREILKLKLQPHRYVLFASRLVREKGAHLLIEAFRQLKTELKLVIAGDAKGSEAYKRQLHSLAAGDLRILFPGYVEGRLLDELFSNCALYVQPSELEGLSIALLEGMSYGKCCLASDIPENREAIGDTGETFISGDVSNLIVRLEQLLGDHNHCATLGHRARERVRERFSWDHVADGFEKLYNEMLLTEHSNE